LWYTKTLQNVSSKEEKGGTKRIGAIGYVKTKSQKKNRDQRERRVWSSKVENANPIILGTDMEVGEVLVTCPGFAWS